MTASRAAQGGNTLAGFVGGLVVGLAIAVAVALYVTKAPIPFINKLGHPPDAPLPEQGKVPDPNRSLYSRDAAANADAPGSVAAITAPGANPAAAPPVVPVQPAARPAPSSGATASNRPAPDASEGKQSYLQAGAYHSLDDAETMKGKLALLGFEAVVTNADREGSILYRVRLGPYSRIEDINRVRQRLAENGVDAAIVSAAKAAT